MRINLNNIIYLLLVISLNSGCNSSSKETKQEPHDDGEILVLRNDHPFKVSVFDQFNEPVPNAVIHGGLDWGGIYGKY